MPAPRIAVVIRNPAARRPVPHEAVTAAAQPLASAGWVVDVFDTVAPAHAFDLAAVHGARPEVEVIVAAGGDGTLHEVVNGVRSVGADCAIGLVPCGTGNVWARETGIPRAPSRALALLASGERVRVDLGVATLEGEHPRRFLLVCGVGLDAAVVRSVEGRGMKRRLGRAAYVLGGAAALARSRPVATRIGVDGEERTARLVLGLAANTRRYGGVLPLADAARVGDGMLDLLLFEARTGWRGRLDGLRLVGRALRGGLSRGRGGGITYRQTARATLEPREPLPVQVDGEYLGECGPGRPLALEVEPRALTFIVGRADSRLFAGTDA